MKTFKGYLKEVPAWTESLSAMIFDLPRAGLVDVKIPLSPSIFKRIWPKSVRSRVFHLTNDVGLRALKKMEGGKRSISAFYNITTSEISYGIQTEGGYVVEMDADVLAAAPDDIGTQPDKTGRRWLVLDTLTTTMGGASKLRGMEKDIEEMMMDIIMQYADDPKFMPDINKSWIALKKEYKNEGKILSLIIKDYIDGMEKVMKKYSAKLKSVLLDYVKKRAQEPDPDSGDLPEWDEIVVNNFKIQKIHVGWEYAEDFEGDDDIEGFPFETYPDSGDLVDYITRTVQRIKL